MSTCKIIGNAATNETTPGKPASIAAGEQRGATEATAGGMEYSDKAAPLFRSTIRRTRRLTQTAMTSDDISWMGKRRMRGAGLPSRFSPHSFRVTTMTAYSAKACR